MADDSRLQVAGEFLKSLDSAVKALLSDEFKSIREAIKSAETSFTQRLVQSESANARAVDVLRSDLSARIADLGKRLDSSAIDQTRSVKDIEGRLSASVAQVDEKSKKGISEVSALLADLRRTVAGDIAAFKAGVDHDNDGLREELQTVMGQLESQTGEIQRVSSVLGGFARIFTGDAPAVAPASAPSGPAVELPKLPRSPSTTPTSSRKSGGVPARAMAEEHSSLPNSGDIVDGIDTMFKLKPGK